MRAETYVEKFISTINTAATFNTTIDLPSGTYYMALSVASSLTGTSTKLRLAPFMDAAQSQVGTLNLYMVQPDSTLAEDEMDFAATAKGTYSHIVASAGTAEAFGASPISVPHGLRAITIKGGAAEGETFAATLTASRIA